MSSSHLFLVLPIALLVLYLELRSGLHSQVHCQGPTCSPAKSAWPSHIHLPTTSSQPQCAWPSSSTSSRFATTRVWSQFPSRATPEHAASTSSCLPCAHRGPWIRNEQPPRQDQRWRDPTRLQRCRHVEFCMCRPEGGHRSSIFTAKTFRTTLAVHQSHSSWRARCCSNSSVRCFRGFPHQSPHKYPTRPTRTDASMSKLSVTETRLPSEVDFKICAVMHKSEAPSLLQSPPTVSVRHRHRDMLPFRQ